VSEVEYLALKKACLETGTQSVSAFARDAVNSVAPECVPGTERSSSNIDRRLRKIEDALELLTQELKKIEQSVEILANAV
jgi:hypothetical protein